MGTIVDDYDERSGSDAIEEGDCERVHGGGVMMMFRMEELSISGTSFIVLAAHMSLLWSSVLPHIFPCQRMVLGPMTRLTLSFGSFPGSFAAPGDL